ncbi:MAG: histone deacetylase [Planctomycetota bacterium]|nr:MAG: histone deacetylase [Planctomycetota bacterium]
MDLALYADRLFCEHETPRDHPECPERALAVADGLRGLEGAGPVRGAVPASADDVARVHDRDYVEALRRAAAEGGGALDLDTWVSPRSYEVALAAAGTVATASEAVFAAGAPPAFVVVRPPGHHARPARGMGFCLFNNVAVAAARVRATQGVERVAIVDFDVHHGNGTQEIFWEDPATFYASLHRYPYYPGTGAADETGSGAGLGSTLNLPLGPRTQPADYRAALRRALDAVVDFGPELLLVSAGFDAYADDPIGGLNLGVEDFSWIGAELRRAADAACAGRLVSALEGGYAVDALGDLAAAYAAGTAGRSE